MSNSALRHIVQTSVRDLGHLASVGAWPWLPAVQWGIRCHSSCSVIVAQCTLCDVMYSGGIDANATITFKRT